MSHWDFGRPGDGQHDAPRPPWPGGTYPPDSTEANGDGAWPAPDGRTADGGRPAPDGWAHEGRSADEQWAAGGGWPPGAGMPADGGWPAHDGFDDGFVDDDDMAPYPLTYERDDFDAVDSRPADSSRAPW